MSLYVWLWVYVGLTYSTTFGDRRQRWHCCSRCSKGKICQNTDTRVNSKCVDPHSVVVILPVVSIVVIIVLPIVATPIPLVLPIVVILEEKSTNQKITSSSIDSRLKRLTLP